jgi:hypothetical protein
MTGTAAWQETQKYRNSAMAVKAASQEKLHDRNSRKTNSNLMEYSSLTGTAA